MIMARSILFAFILLLTTNATFTAATAPAPAAGLQEEKSPLGLLFPFGNPSQCLDAINKVENCFSELLASFLSFRFHVSKECCNVITNASNKCLSHFSPSFSTQLKSFCSVIEGSASV